MGKTGLLAETARRRERAGDLVLSATGTELERGFGFGAVRQLFESLIDGGEVRFEGPVAPAEVAFGLTAAEPSGDSPLPVIHGLFRMVAEIAARRSLVLLVDDAQWVDLSSLRFLDYLAARHGRLDLRLVIASRQLSGIPGESPDPTTVLLARIRDRPDTTLIVPTPLGVPATAQLLAEAMGREADLGFAAECQAAAAGNPFFLHELADAMAAEGLAPDRREIDRVGEFGPGSIARSVKRRTQHLPPDADLVLGAISVLESQATSSRVAAITEIPTAEVSLLADRLAGVDLLVDGRPLGFRHPIVRRAVYGELPAGRRAALHAAAARALATDGMSPEGIGPHVLQAEPAGDDRVVGQLRSAAAAAMGEGEPELARQYLERARREPPGEGSRADVTAELGMAEAALGKDLDYACELLEQAAGQVEDPASRIGWIEEASQVRLFGGQAEVAFRLLWDELERLGPEDRELRLRLIARAAGIGLLRPEVAGAALPVLEEYREVAGDTPAELVALAELGGIRWHEGRILEALEFARRALADGRLLENEGPVSPSFNHAVAILIYADEYEAAAAALADGISMANRRGTLPGLAGLVALRALVAWGRGDTEGVIAESAIVLDLLEESGTPMVNPNILGFMAMAMVDRGELDAAGQTLARIGDVRDLPPLTFLVAPFLAMARLELARSRPEAALELLTELEAGQEAMGVRHMSVPWGYTAVEAAVACGRPERAREIASRQMERAERWRVPALQGLCLAASGLATGGPEGIRLMTEGADLLESSPARLDLAHVLIDLGALLRRSGRRADARDPLRRGLDVANQCGASGLAARAELELATAGARPRRRQFSGVGSLTASERRVAELAAAGATNREIAASLVISVRTVENHLARCYRKLGIGSRRDLASSLASDPTGHDGTYRSDIPGGLGPEP